MKVLSSVWTRVKEWHLSYSEWIYAKANKRRAEQGWEPLDDSHIRRAKGEDVPEPEKTTFNFPSSTLVIWTANLTLFTVNLFFSWMSEDKTLRDVFGMDRGAPGSQSDRQR